jgi:hypothetical protein
MFYAVIRGVKFQRLTMPITLAPAIPAGPGKVGGGQSPMIFTRLDAPQINIKLDPAELYG